MIIGLAGKKQCGKTEIAKHISAKTNMMIYRFAGTLKDLIFEMSGLNDNDKISHKRLNRTINYFVLNKYLKKYGYEKLTENEIDHIKAIEYNDIGVIYRTLLQYVGTNILRNRNPNHWIQEFSKLTYGNKSYIVDDIRFINEYNYINGLSSSKIYKVIRPSIDDNDNHESEAEIDKIKFELLFKNIAIDISELHQHINVQILGE